MFHEQVVQRHRVRPRPLWGQGWRKGVFSLRKRFSTEHKYSKKRWLHMTGHPPRSGVFPEVGGSPKGLLVIPGISRVAKEHPVRPGNLCHAPCLGNAPVGMKRRVAIKDLGYVPYSRLPSMRKDRNEDLCCPFPWNPVPEERLTIISSKPGPDAPVMIAAVTGVPSPVVRVRR